PAQALLSKSVETMASTTTLESSKGGGTDDCQPVNGRLGNGGHAGKRDRTARRERRALRLNVVVDDAVIAPVDDTVVIEIAIGISIRARHLDEVVNDAVVAAVD